MRELPQCLSHTESFNYADDSALLKVFGHNSAVWSVDHFSRQTLGRHQALEEVNADLSSLTNFGKTWKVAFEPAKTHAMLVSNTSDYCFPYMPQLSFGAVHVKFEEEVVLVVFVFHKKLTWKPMLNKVCSKGRQALGAMRRLKNLLGCSELAVLSKLLFNQLWNTEIWNTLLLLRGTCRGWTESKQLLNHCVVTISPLLQTDAKLQPLD